MSIKIWQRVPSGSNLEILIEPGEGFGDGDHPWDSRVRILDDLGRETILTDADVTPGPRLHVLTTPRLYSARIRVALAGKGTGTVRALVRKPDASLHGTPFSFQFDGSAGNVFPVSLGVITLQG